MGVDDGRPVKVKAGITGHDKSLGVRCSKLTPYLEARERDRVRAGNEFGQ